MIQQQSQDATRGTLVLSTVGTLALCVIGYAISAGTATNLLAALGLAIAAVAIAAVSPGAAVGAVLLASPTMYDLYPMPRGDFSLLELAIVFGTVGVGVRSMFDGVHHGFRHLIDLFLPAQLIVPVGLLLVATAVSLATVADPAYRTESLREVRTVIIEPLLFLMFARMAMRQTAIRTFAGSMLAVAGTIVAGYAVAQIALDLGGVQAGSVTRATATYTHPNNLALFLERTVLLTVGIIAVRPRWWPVWMLAAVQFAGLALTYSRGAMIALVAGIAIILVLRRLYAWLVLLAAGGLGAATLGAILFPERLIDAGGAGAEPTRFTIWRASLRMALDHPIFGVGPDQFLYQYSRRYIEPMGWPERYTSHPHNIILDVWLRLGALGLAAAATLAAGVIWWIRNVADAIRRDPLALGALAALAGGLAHGLVDNGFFLPDLAALTWFFIALVFTVPRHSAPDPEKEQLLPMERTWPVVSREDTVGPEASGSRLEAATWLALGAAVLFLTLQFVPGNGYLAFVMVALIGLITIANPAWGVAAVLVTIPVQDVVMVPFVRGELTYTQVTLAGLVMGWAVTLPRHRIWLDSIVAGFLAVFAAFSFSMVELDDPGLWVAEVYRWGAAAVFFLICRSVLRDWIAVRTALYGIMAGLVGTIIYIGWELSEWLDSFGVERIAAFRAMGTFGVPNPLAAYAEFCVPVLLIVGLFGFRARLREQIGKRFWVLSLIAAGCGLLTIGLTQSRGGWVGTAVALLMVFIVLPRRTQIVSVALGGVLVVGFLLTPIGQSQIDRFVGSLDEEPSPVRNVHQGMLGRESLWIAGIRMIEDEPLTGVGAGEYDYHYREYTPHWIDRFPRGQAHNGWIHMGAQAGIPGIVAFTVWLTASLLSLAGAVRRSTTEISRLLAWGSLAIMVAFAVHSLVDYLNVLSLGLQISAVTAIGLALAPASLPSMQDDPAHPESIGRAVTEAVPSS